MIAVKILRGDFLEPLEYMHADLEAARMRAQAACALHSATSTEDIDTLNGVTVGYICVNANAYYGDLETERERCARLNERMSDSSFRVWLVTTREGRKSYYVTRPQNKPSHGTSCMDVTEP